MADEWLQTRLAKTEEQIESIENAVIALADGTIQSYTLDNGQTRTVVSRHEIGRLQSTLDVLYARRTSLHDKINGGGTVNVTPGW